MAQAPTAMTDTTPFDDVEMEYDRRTLTERAVFWDHGDRAELVDLFDDLGEMFHDAMRADEAVDDDVQQACVELLANPNLPTFYRAQAELWMVCMVEEGAEDTLKSAQYWINDLEIVAESSGLEDPRIERLQAEAEELRAQLEPQLLKKDPARVRLEEIMASRKAASQTTTQKPQKGTEGEETKTPEAADPYTVGIGPNSGLPIRLIPGNKVTPADIGPEISWKEKLERNKAIAKYERDVMQMEAENEAEAARLDDEAIASAESALSVTGNKGVGGSDQEAHSTQSDAAGMTDTAIPAPSLTTTSPQATATAATPAQEILTPAATTTKPELETEEHATPKYRLKRGGNPSLRRKASNRAFLDIGSARQLKKKVSSRKGLADLFNRGEEGGEDGEGGKEVADDQITEEASG